ncbi:hypothetical protein Celaphus_00005946 [Cervus elaphus hippelaphus]|uniref:Uncharacterized protein n=1 Tax=Cervus elaphus hippelaphus TaxID=46360 RepID=A0A212CTQ6_CEREH|nr:hypothetical protein Celaphus_00005946 [Cervus elaphus hippelaphus]
MHCKHLLVKDTSLSGGGSHGDLVCHRHKEVRTVTRLEHEEAKPPEGARGGSLRRGKKTNQKTKSPRVAPPGLRGAGGHALPPQSGSTHFWRDRVAEAEPDLRGGVG